MRKTFVVLMVLALMVPAFAFGKPPAQEQATVASAYMIDNFEDGEITASPEWWVFDNVTTMFKRNPAKGAYSLALTGKAIDWYVGGMGTYLAKGELDLSQYSYIEMDIYSAGPENGSLKIELYDDDNGNWQIEQDPKKAYAPVFDDRFVYEQKIDWSGWKRVAVPFSSFVDNNPNAGDNIWNPQKQNASGGLLQMQLIAVAGSKTGAIDYCLDNIKFTLR
ncbi:hypothetical protein ACFL52_01050 [Candidatus Margulisiibacteriota bacterium]